MVAFILVIETFVAHHESDLFLKIDAWTWGQTSRLVGRRATKSQVICLGDSLVQVGIASPLLEKQTGLSTCNLAISGGQAASSYFLLRRVLEEGGQPVALVLDFFPRHLQSSPLLGVDPWISLTSLRDVVDLACAGRDAEFLGRVTLAKILPTARARPEIRNALRAAWNGDDQGDRHHVPPFLKRNLTVNCGGLLCPSGPASEKDLDAWTQTYFSPDWTCDPVNRRYIKRLLDLAQSRQIPVFWLLPPLQPALQEHCERSGFDRRHLEFVREHQEKYPNVTILDGRHCRYDPAVFFDPHHLARDGAAIFSADVAQSMVAALKADMAGSRWVKLPSFGIRRIDGTLEDVEQSRVAAKLARARRLH